jgi:hypothetical protein
MQRGRTPGGVLLPCTKIERRASVLIFLVAALVVAILVALAAFARWRDTKRAFPSGEISFVAFVLLALFLISRL